MRSSVDDAVAVSELRDDDGIRLYGARAAGFGVHRATGGTGSCAGNDCGGGGDGVWSDQREAAAAAVEVDDAISAVHGVADRAGGGVGLEAGVWFCNGGAAGKIERGISRGGLKRRPRFAAAQSTSLAQGRASRECGGGRSIPASETDGRSLHMRGVRMTSEMMEQ